MTPDDARTMLAALEAFISDLSVRTNDGLLELERARELRNRAAAVIDADVHVSDESLVPEVLKPGDLLRVSTAILKEWIDSGTSSTVVMVKHIERNPDDGSKTVVVTAPMVNG